MVEVVSNLLCPSFIFFGLERKWQGPYHKNAFYVRVAFPRADRHPREEKQRLHRGNCPGAWV